MSEHVNLELGDNGGEASKKYSRVKSREMTEKKEETSLSKESKNEMIIVSKVENIYLSIRSNPKYFTRLRVLIFLSSALFYSLIWLLYSMISTPRNKMFCFSTSSQEFIICEPDNFCSEDSKGIANYFYVTNTDLGLTDPVTINESYKVNKFLRTIFFQDYLIYSKSSYDLINRFEESSIYFNNIVVFTYKENFNLFLTFRQMCDRTSTLVETGIFLFLGYSVGNIVICYLADLFGRKKLLVQNSICCGLCSIGIGIFSLVILNASKVSLDPSDFVVPDGINMMADVYQNYIKNLKQIQENIQETNLIRYYFSNFKFLFYLLIFLIGINLSSSLNISRAYILEKSVNDTEIYNSYNYLFYGLILSFFSDFILCKLCDNFHLPFIILGAFLVILGILIQILLEESPRYLYEFFEYKRMTEFFRSKILTNELDKFYMPCNDEKIQAEIRKNSRSTLESTFKGLINIIINKKNLDQATLLEGESLYMDHNQIFRADIINNPFLFFSLMKRNKHIRKHYLIIGSLIINIALIYYISIISINKAFVISKSELYNIFNTNILVITIIFYFSQMFFYFLLKFFGYNIILFICFFMLFIFSLIIQLKDILVRENEDMNRFPFNSENIVYSFNRTYFFANYCIMLFFSYGLFYSMFLYLTKYTKTIYRCFFYGICQILIDFTMIFSNSLEIYFDKNMFFVTLASLIGFINAYFVNQDFDYSIISDFRQLELLNKNEKSKNENNNAK